MNDILTQKMVVSVWEHIKVHQGKRKCVTKNRSTTSRHRGRHVEVHENRGKIIRLNVPDI